MDAVQFPLGLVVIDPEYKVEIKSGSGSQFGDRISSLLDDVAHVVTEAGALPFLHDAIQTALNLLSRSLLPLTPLIQGVLNTGNLRLCGFSDLNW